MPGAAQLRQFGDPSTAGRLQSAVEVGQLGSDGELGGGPEDRVDVGVDDLDDAAGQGVVVEGYAVAGGGVQGAEGLADLVEPFAGGGRGSGRAPAAPGR